MPSAYEAEHVYRRSARFFFADSISLGARKSLIRALPHVDMFREVLRAVRSTEEKNRKETGAQLNQSPQKKTEGPLPRITQAVST